MKFGKAIKLMEQGYKLKRTNWNGDDQFVFLVKGETLGRTIEIHYTFDKVDSNLFRTLFDHNTFSDLLAIKTTSNQIQLGWLASQTDMLSDDWEVIENEQCN